MSSLLRRYISEILAEMKSNPAVSDEILPQNSGVNNPRTLDTVYKEEDKESESDEKKNKDRGNEDVEEMNVVANIAGYTAPLGASSADVGANPTKPGQKLKKKNRKDFVRWK